VRRARIAATVACVCAAIAAAGCGGAAERDYAEEYTAVSSKIGKEIGTLESTPTADPAKLGSQLRALAGALGDAAKELAAVDPPDDAKAGHAKVQTGVETLAADLRGAAKKLCDASSPAATVEALGAIASSKGAAQIQAGEQELRDAGYKVQ
jgi:hypothetical protein